MHPITLEHSLSLPRQTPRIETPAPLACLYCGATQASVRPQHEIIDARMDCSAECVCCDCETGNACPHCLSENLEYESYDFGGDLETGYSDSGERYRCRDCGATGDAEDAAPALVMFPPPMRKPILATGVAADMPEVA